jgi:hypothetical protein
MINVKWWWRKYELEFAFQRIEWSEWRSGAKKKRISENWRKSEVFDENCSACSNVLLILPSFPFNNQSSIIFLSSIIWELPSDKCILPISFYFFFFDLNLVLDSTFISDPNWWHLHNLIKEWGSGRFEKSVILFKDFILITKIQFSHEFYWIHNLPHRKCCLLLLNQKLVLYWTPLKSIEFFKFLILIRITVFQIGTIKCQLIVIKNKLRGVAYICCFAVATIATEVDISLLVDLVKMKTIYNPRASKSMEPRYYYKLLMYLQGFDFDIYA